MSDYNFEKNMEKIDLDEIIAEQKKDKDIHKLESEEFNQIKLFYNILKKKFSKMNNNIKVKQYNSSDKSFINESAILPRLYLAYIAFMYPDNVMIDNRFTNPTEKWLTNWNKAISLPRKNIFTFRRRFGGYKKYLVVIKSIKQKK